MDYIKRRILTNTLEMGWRITYTNSVRDCLHAFLVLNQWGSQAINTALGTVRVYFKYFYGASGMAAYI